MADGDKAPSLPNMFPSLSARQVAVRRGEVNVIAGQPGAGKSTLAMALAVRSQSPTLYVSADTHEHTMSMRLITMLTGATTDVVEQAMIDKEWAASVMEQADYFTWSFDSAPSPETIENEILAHIELNGVAPRLTVVDNLTDIAGGEGDEWAGMRGLMKDFKFLAREYDTAFMVLHHTGDEYLEPGTCPPRWRLMGKVAQTPALILTVAQDDAGFLGVCPVKNRYGPSNPNGKEPSWLKYDPSRMLVEEWDEPYLPSTGVNQTTAGADALRALSQLVGSTRGGSVEAEQGEQGERGGV